MSGREAAVKVAQLTRDLATGGASHIAVSRILPRVGGNAFVRLISDYPHDSVPRKNGPRWSFDTDYALVSTVTNRTIADEFPRVWLTGSLLAVGDALKANDYFDHAPELELIYHLRNGIAHGNRFDIRNPKRLAKYPAHNRACHLYAIFEITPALNGQSVLFDFMEAGDVLDLLFSVGLHLDRIGRGESS
jgi:hypothetical protein